MIHPNRVPFTGVAMFVDTPSDQPLTGSRGHRLVFTREAVLDALPTLIGMGINCSASLTKHSAVHKIGVITAAWLMGREVFINGYLYAHDFPQIAKELEAEDFGISVEAYNCHIENMTPPLWVATRFIFTGAAIVRAHSAAFRGTSFHLLNHTRGNSVCPDTPLLLA